MHLILKHHAQLQMHMQMHSRTLTEYAHTAHDSHIYHIWRALFFILLSPSLSPLSLFSPMPQPEMSQNRKLSKV